MYDHFVAVDWAESNVAVARMTAKVDQVKVTEGRIGVGDLRDYLKRLKGKVILTVEETTTAQWLYTELRPHVSEMVICDPRRNKLLSEGGKTDKMDAKKLVQLLKANMLKPVFHTADQFIYYRKLVSGYCDTVQSGVRLKNQRHALYRASGKNVKDDQLDRAEDLFVLEGIHRSIAGYEMEKKRYCDEFRRICQIHQLFKAVKTVPGIDVINAVKVGAYVVTANRFPDNGKFLSYVGQIKYECISGGRSYGKRKTRYNRILKNVFDTAACACIQGNAENPMRQFYDYLRTEKRYPDHHARRAVARKIATLAYGVMKSGKKYDPKRSPYYQSKIEIELSNK